MIAFFSPSKDLTNIHDDALLWTKQHQSEMIDSLTNHWSIDLQIAIEHPILFVLQKIWHQDCPMVCANLLFFTMTSLRNPSSSLSSSSTTTFSLSSYNNNKSRQCNQQHHRGNNIDNYLAGQPPQPRSSCDTFLLNIHGASLSICDNTMTTVYHVAANASPSLFRLIDQCDMLVGMYTCNVRTIG